jgi:predicted nucleic acid-binding protein
MDDRSVLADTGALLALLDPRDRWHERCVVALGEIYLPMTTTEAVLTELFHLVGDAPRARAAAWALVRATTALAELADDDLAAIERHMAKYGDLPMDFADATLLRIAERESIATVFTVDHADFSVYRIGGRKRFRIVPAPR